MGSPLSSVIADVFNRGIWKSNIELSTSKTHYDDALVIGPHGLEALHRFVAHLNSLFDTIDFTMEMEEGGKLTFLDISLIQQPNGSIERFLYCKPTYINLYLPHESPSHTKILRLECIGW